MENKTELRQRAKDKRISINTPALEQKIIIKIRNHQAYKNSKNVMLYYPMLSEINLLDLLKDNKNFYFPRVSGKEILVCPNTGKFSKSNMSVMEPDSSPVEPEILDLVIVPALYVDKYNYRLGYGGGFYDRFLSRYPNITTIVPISKEFVCENLPIDKCDVKVDYVVSC